MNRHTAVMYGAILTVLITLMVAFNTSSVLLLFSVVLLIIGASPGKRTKIK